MSSKIIFLYAEITTYFLSSLKELENSNLYQIKVVYNSKNEELINSYDFYNILFFPISNFRDKNELLTFSLKYAPKAIFISGFMNSQYLYVARKFKGLSKIICLYDTIPQNTLIYNLKNIFKKYIYKYYFDYMWGTGSLNVEHAKNIGFNDKQIFSGFYVCDKVFSHKYFEVVRNKELNILFIGRLVKEKNILFLVNTVNKLIKRNYKIRLTIIGEGPLKSSLEVNENIVHLGFLSKGEIINVAKRNNLFCLPSIYEPWGVVVHEMSSLGLPLLLSNRCGSSKDLLINYENGLSFDPMNSCELENKIIEIYNYDQAKFSSMSEKSRLVSKKINHQNWFNNLKRILN